MTGQPPPKVVYPSHADYDTAVENLHVFVFDPVLKTGRPKLRRDDRPLYYLGGFAKAYVIECQGKTYALRVWLSDIGDAAHRYAAVSQYCGQVRLPIFVEDFTYVPSGILVNGHRFPLLRMEWVQGQTLGDFIGGRLGDGTLLRAAAREFLAMVRTLHGQGMAHGDLQSDNMLVSVAPGGVVTFKLIDYDTLMVPALAGWPITSTGLPCYQHPRRGKSGLATVRDDYFSELVIYLSLLAVAENPNLWQQHPVPPVKRDKELLFVAEDFVAAHPTPVFHSLHRQGGLVRSLAVALWNFTRFPGIGDLIPLEEVLAQAEAAHARPAAEEEKSAFERLLAGGIGGTGALPGDLFDDTAFTRPVPVVTPRTTAKPTRPAENFQSKMERMAPAPAPARPVARPRAAPQPRPRTATPWTPKRRAVLMVVVLVVLGWVWRELRPAPFSQPPRVAAQNSSVQSVPLPAAATLAGASATALAGAHAGDLRAADLGGGVKLLLCGIPAGTFTMGGSGSDEKKHEVTLTKPFWLGRTEVTQGQWEAVMGNNPSHFKGKDLPVEQVSWDDAQEFCKKLNEKSLLPAGWQWALPTEAQWEYACRAGTTGDYADSLDDMAWYSANIDSKTHAVATKKANAWGLHDMHGNVWEWCADRYGAYPTGAVTDPTGSNSGSTRVYRGGSWIHVGPYCRSACRNWFTPDSRSSYIGFRLAAVPAEREPAGAGVPASGAGARDERAALLAGTDAAELAAAKAGDRRAADLGGGTELILLGVAPGTFTMGGSESNERRHEVTLTKSFWLGRTEVTQGQWEVVMGINPSNFKGKELPVEMVSWDDALEFCKKLNAKSLLPAGWHFALPSEAQWEYACRAGTTGDYAGSLDDMAWYSANSGDKTHPVATKKANPWGFHDMHGNVWEWCADRYGEYPAGSLTDSTGSNSGSYRVYRGGSWGNAGSHCRSAYRFRFTPDYRNGSIGFRVAAVPAERGREPAAAVVPARGAEVRDERAAPVVDVSGAKARVRREADLGGGVKLELCGIPAGTFRMGGTGAVETPHAVTLTKSFWLGRTEVTQRQWQAVMKNNPSKSKGEDLPVEMVSWNNATEFCGKLNAKGLLPPGWHWALPTEAQWEYACRAGTTGDYAGRLDEMAWYSSNSGSKTHAVGTKKANAWGLYDMHGNVWEWCADWHAKFPGGAAIDPIGANSGSVRVLRSGSWNVVGTNCRSANRSGGSPDSRYGSIGFRVAAVPGGS